MPAVTVRSSPNGFPIATTASPTRTASESPRGRGVRARACALIFKRARSVEGSTPDDRRLDAVVAREIDLDLAGAFDHVVVRDDVAVLVDDEPGAERNAGLRAEEGIARVDGRGGDLEDAGACVLVDLLDGQGVIRVRLDPGRGVGQRSRPR